MPEKPEPGVVHRQCPSSDGDPPAGRTVDQRHTARAPTNGVRSHDDVAYVNRRTTRVDVSTGWVTVRAPRKKLRPRRSLVALILLLPLVLGSVGAPGNPGPVHGDELSDAKAKQAALKKDVAEQKARVAQLASLQGALSSEIRETQRQLRAVGADLNAVRKKITKMESRIEDVKLAYAGLIVQVSEMDALLQAYTAREAAKRVELGERRALLADRVRNAYDTDRTSPLETLLSSGNFTDLLAEMSFYIDVAEQDKALAEQISRDKEAVAVLHQTVADTRDQTNVLRQETAAQKRELDRSLEELKDTRAELKKLERAVAKSLREQKARYAAIARNKASAARIIRAAAAKQKALAREIDKLIEKQISKGKIPSQYNGTFRWPMDNFNVSGEYGCSSFTWYAPGNGCAHYHNGIDLVAPYGTKVKAAGAGTVVYVGWNWADGADPAWIVVIAHSGSLRTWYAHMQPKRPVSVGEHVSKGQVIGYEGNTGNSTGAHLHWMVEQDGSFTNPRLFL
jgi:murein DD-endopeptidase MepM/ murein hydrolase activator NlpD